MANKHRSEPRMEKKKPRRLLSVLLKDVCRSYFKPDGEM